VKKTFCDACAQETTENLENHWLSMRRYHPEESSPFDHPLWFDNRPTLKDMCEPCAIALVHALDVFITERRMARKQVRS